MDVRLECKERQRLQWWETESLGCRQKVSSDGQSETGPLLVRQVDPYLFHCDLKGKPWEPHLRIMFFQN